MAVRNTMENEVRIIIADGHHAYRNGLKMVVNTMKSLVVIGVFNRGLSLLEALEYQVPDIILMDISIPDIGAVELIRGIKTKHPAVGIIALSMSDEDAYCKLMMDAGANAFLFKGSRAEILEKTILDVMATASGSTELP